MSATNIHPKTSASALGGALGFLIVAVLDSLHGVNLSTAASAAIPTFLSTLGAYVAPSPTDTQPVAEAAPAAVDEDMAGLTPRPEPILAPEPVAPSAGMHQAAPPAPPAQGV